MCISSALRDLDSGSIWFYSCCFILRWLFITLLVVLVPDPISFDLCVCICVFFFLTMYKRKHLRMLNEESIAISDNV